MGGRSIGSGPTIDLAIRHPEIRGMVLQSPIESCLRVFANENIRWMGEGLDIFKNYEKIDRVTCPVLIMHGAADKVVPIENAVALHAQCTNAVEPLWLQAHGHNDMPSDI